MDIVRFRFGMAALTALATLASAQFPATPSGLSVVTSTVNEEVKISYKQIDICETTPGVKSYSGFVHLPGSLAASVGGFDLNSYFMYFEARNNPETAPVAVYLAGGPGEASSFAAFDSENGPCYVNPNGVNTTLNPWSFNNDVSMLYIDQPIMAGYSYSQMVNISSPDVEGTFPDQNPLSTSNTTVASARALWLFAEHWFSSFPEYNTSSNKISFWGNSYGGFYVPQTATTISKHLEQLTDCHPLKEKNLSVDAIGITNGCIDFEYQMEGFPEFANNNTYGVKFYNETTYREVQNNITKDGGCLDLIKTCRQAADVGDPDYIANNATVNELCIQANNYCAPLITLLYEINNVSTFDVALQTPDTCTYTNTVAKYFNLAQTQSALGVPLNYTWYSGEVLAVFGSTGDNFRQSNLPNLKYLLDKGVKIAIIHGDRDYTCPWTGGETVAKTIEWKNQEGFDAAGYQELQGLGSGAKGGVVKQYGQLSFTRVFESGHAVSAYAPETVWSVFSRTLLDNDIATGTESIRPDYHTTGPTDSRAWMSKMPAPIRDSCILEGKFWPSDIFA